MKEYRVTVNGQVYQVSIEEVGTNTPAPKPTAAPAGVPSVQTTPAPQATQVPKTAEGYSVTAPMPGAILEIAVNEGQTVQAGEVVLLLEAMKMENEIIAPVSGNIKKIVTSKGATVNTGDLLLVIE